MHQIEAMGRNLFTHQHGRSCKFFYAAMVLCFLIASLQASCSPGPGKETSERDQGILQSYTQDQFTLIQRTSKKEISIAEQLEVVLETAVPENTDVEFPSYSASLGDFSLKDTRILPDRMIGSGDTIRVVKNDADVAKLVTEEIQLPVHSLLTPDASEVEIKDIRPPLSLPPDRIQQFLLGGLVLLMTALVISGIIYWHKRASRKLPPPVQVRPEEIALQELDRLLSEDLLARGEIKFFHIRISDILRQYIENRFGLKAPERTTEEFLVALSLAKSSENALLGKHRALLGNFLTQCDLVKFAKHEPSIAESEKTVVICREFIGKTGEEGERLKAEGKMA